jgi:hypothetical protein
VLLENFKIKDDFQDEPPLVSDVTTSQKAKRVPETYIGWDPNLNSSSITWSRRRNIVEGKARVSGEVDGYYPQRGWLSRIRGIDGIDGIDRYIFDSIGGEGSFVYVVDFGINAHHAVSNFFRFVGFFLNKKLGY